MNHLQTTDPVATVVRPGSLAERVGLDLETLKKLERPHTCSIGASGYVAVDGTFIAGISYRTDYRYEEEAGIGKLRQALTSSNPRRFALDAAATANIAYFDDVNGIVLSTSPLDARTLTWGDPVPYGWQPGITEYADDYTYALGFLQERKHRALRWASVAELKAIAKEYSISPLPRTKSGLIAAITTHPRAAAGAGRPELWPAWFRHGTQLVLRADSGITGDLLAGLIAAARAGTLGIGSGSGPYVSGLFFYDTRDETDAVVAAREADFDLYDERMAALAPVRAELEQRGHRFFALGNPRAGGLKTASGVEDDAVRYWLNGAGRPQPYGWYSLAELLAEKFIDDAAQRAS